MQSELWPLKLRRKCVEDWAAWKYYCRHLRAAVQYFDILHMHSRKRWETHLASYIVVTFVAINKINKYSHELSVVFYRR